MNKVINSIFLAIVSILAGILLAGQLLGFFALYYPWLVIILSILLTGIIGFVLFKKVNPILLGLLEPETGLVKHPILEYAGLIAGFALLVFLLILPLVFWPQTGINHELTWDAGLYHLPKAAELVVNHSAWDFSIAYGEYPWGFESLIAFSFLFSSSGMLIGLTHALIVLLFAFSLFFLAARFSRIPRGLLFFGVIAVICSFDMVRGWAGNPWWVFRVLAFTIGKNDFFLAASILTLLVFSPIGPRGMNKTYSLEGMGVASALVLSTKPNGIPVVVLVWLFVIAAEMKQARSNKTTVRQAVVRWVPPFLFILAGSLWVIRNLIGTGRLVSAASLEIQHWSILNNVTNPFLYHYLGKNFIFLMILLGFSILYAFFFHKFHWNIPLTFFILIFSFAATPSSAFFGSNLVPAQIAWRFGADALAFELVVLLAMLDPLLVWLFSKQFLPLEILLAVAILCLAGWSSYQNRDRIRLSTANTIVLRDLYPSSVGVDGYYSAYDYVQKNVRNSVVWVENGYPFYVFGPGLTNTVTRSRPADYWVFFQTALINAGGYPKNLASPEWNSKWQLVYEDGEGRVYHRK